MRRILCKIPHRPTTVVSSFCAAVGGGGATVAAAFPTAGDGGGGGHGFLPNLEKPKPHNFVKVEAEEAKFTDIFSVSVGQNARARKQLKNEERARNALGILFRDYCGRATPDDDEEKVNKTKKENVTKRKKKLKITEEEFDAFVNNLSIECGADYEKYKSVGLVFYKLIDNELGDATQNNRVDKLAEIAELELDAFATNSFTTKLMIECEPEYEKRFRQVIEKVRKKIIRDDGILKAFKLVTNLMNKCEPEYEKLLCEVLENVCEKITQDEKVGNENIHKIEKLAELDMKVGNIRSFEEKLDEFITKIFLTNLRMYEKLKPYFMAYEVIEEVAKKVGTENVRKLAEEKLDALVTNSFVTNLMVVEMNKPFFMYLRLCEGGSSTEE